MIPCPYCPEEKATPQGLSGHIRMKHPLESSNDAGSNTSSNASARSTGQVVVSDAEPVLDNRHPLARAELEQRFIRTLDELDRLPQAIEEIRESLAELESRVGESGELSDRISDIHLLLTDLVDRAEGGFEAETPDDSQPAQAEPPRSFFATDDEMKREFPLLFGEGA